MKAKLLLIPVAAFLMAACADLGFGVDVDSCFKHQTRAPHIEVVVAVGGR